MATLLSVGIILRVGSRPAQLFFHAARERMTAQNPPATVRPSVPAPKTFDGKPQDLQSWLFGFEMYFAAYRLDYTGADSEYCCNFTALLFHSNALNWFRLVCIRNPT